MLGYDLGTQEVSVADAYAFMDAVATASDRVDDHLAAMSASGDEEVRYAIVGRADRMTDGALGAVQAALITLRDPNATPAAVDAAVDIAPAILWVAANVHGETSGADASLRALYELAARSDCVVDGIATTRWS